MKSEKKHKNQPTLYETRMENIKNKIKWKTVANI